MAKLFDYVVFDDMVEGTGPVYSKPEFNVEMTRPDLMALLFQTSQVSLPGGGTGAVNVAMEFSADAVVWTDLFPPFTAALVTSAVTIGVLAAGGAPASPFARLRIFLTLTGGTTLKSRLRIVASGRNQ